MVLSRRDNKQGLLLDRRPCDLYTTWSCNAVQPYRQQTLADSKRVEYLDNNELGKDFDHRGGKPGLVGHGVHNHGHLSIAGPAKIQLHDHLISARGLRLVNLHPTHLRCVVTQVKPVMPNLLNVTG